MPYTFFFLQIKVYNVVIGPGGGLRILLLNFFVEKMNAKRIMRNHLCSKSERLMLAQCCEVSSGFNGHMVNICAAVSRTVMTLDQTQ